jgi:hypothetical protein
MNHRVSRKQRADNRASLLKITLWCLGILFVLVLTIRYHHSVVASISTLLSSGEHRQGTRTRIDLNFPNIDSLFMKTFSELGLEEQKPKRIGENEKSWSSKHSPQFKARWPAAYPLVWFTQKLQMVCFRYDSLRYDAIEKSGGKGLLAAVINGRDTLGRIELTIDARCLPGASSIAFVFDRFDDLTTAQKKSLINLNIPFGYILRPNQIPNRELGKVLNACRGECILEIPVDKGGWTTILGAVHMTSVGKGGRPGEKNVAALLARFSAIDGFYLDNTTILDKDIIADIISPIKKMGLTYIYNNSIPNYADSIISSQGLKIGRFINKMDFRGLKAAELKRSILARIVILAEHNKGTYMLDSRPENIEIINSMMPFLAAMNVIVCAPMTNTELIDRL